MKKKFIHKNYLKKAKLFNPPFHSESTLFILNDEVLKFIKKEILKERESIVNNLDIIDHPNCVTPNFIMYDKTGFLGYGMDLIKNCRPLSWESTFDTSFDRRKEIAFEICDLFSYLESKKFAYYDIHSNNLLYSNHKLKLVDLDSGIFENADNIVTYDSMIRFEKKIIARVILAILYGENPDDFKEKFDRRNFDKLEYLKNCYPNELKKFLEFVINTEFSHFESRDYIELFNEDLIYDTRFILKHIK